jgi:hypothetical protein
MVVDSDGITYESCPMNHFQIGVNLKIFEKLLLIDCEAEEVRS